MNISKLITAKKNQTYSGYYAAVKNLLLSGYSAERSRFAALNPQTWTVK
jgi:hypothetical protein